MADAKAARAERQHVFSLTDRFGAQLATEGDQVDPIDVRVTLAPPPADGDIEAIAFIVLMSAAQSARDDLKAIMEGVRAINEAKAKQRRLLDERNRLAVPAHEAALDLDSIVLLLGALLAQEIDSDARGLLTNPDAGELQALQMQMMIDRISKAISVMSNILKKLSETQSTIVQNLK
jgi:hypothetical protein